MKTWLCHQIGSREYYSIPRALHRQNALGLLQTDAWVPPDRQWIPRLIKRPALASRYHTELADASVSAFTTGRIAFDLKAKLRKKSNWETTAQRDLWFQHQCLPALGEALKTHPQSVTFSYSYTAKHLFQEAKRFGSRCVLGQIDPGPAEDDWLREVLPQSIADEVDTRPEDYWAAWREEISLADRILVNSEWSSQLLTERAGVPSEKIAILPLAYRPPVIDFPARTYPDAFSQNRPLRILFLGQVIPRKGVHILLKAMHKLADKPVQLDLVGPVAMNLGDLPNNVKLHGSVNTLQAREFYENADAFILPTFSDGFAITQLEAAAFRLPLIVSRHLGAVVQDGENGSVLEDLSSEAICATLDECLKAPNTLDKWSAFHLDWDQYSLDQLGERLLSLAAG